MDKLIIDEPHNIFFDLAAAQAWLQELKELKAQGHDVGFYLERAREAVTAARELAPL